MISLLTPSLNAARYIGFAIDSASHPAVREHIVIDGGSTDDTVGTVRCRSHVRVEERPGSGLYDALNIGLELAKGEYIGFLNADDVLLPGALEKCAAALIAARGTDVISGHAVLITSDQPYDAGQFRAARRIMGASIAPGPLLFGVPVMNARIYRRSSLQKIGGFREDLPLAADREMLLRLAAITPREISLDADLYAYRVHAGSKTLSGSPDSKRRIWREHMDLAISCLGAGKYPAGSPGLWRQWLALETAKACFFETTRGRPDLAARAVMRAGRADPFWLTRLPSAFLTRRHLKLSEASGHG